jgi:hypothetical protein
VVCEHCFGRIFRPTARDLKEQMLAAGLPV